MGMPHPTVAICALPEYLSCKVLSSLLPMLRWQYRQPLDHSRKDKKMPLNLECFWSDIVCQMQLRM
ncbi:hypothetical protein COLO4_35855 [Corchorus olitorius]|uniref:Uncharacterized protein n=1 Tax=Corchorus olitorius TaxID=93759 RepID=A0A1R3GCN2_9ROSI|nr:hypothetical protein COLO4_35855 [Corchorus olitorius]